MGAVQEFNVYRVRINAKIMAKGNLVVTPLFNLGTNAYKKGALSAASKELTGLVASIVLRCNDCIKYYLEKCYGLGATKKELLESFSVANIVGGTIVIPNLRRAVEYWEVPEIR